MNTGFKVLGEMTMSVKRKDGSVDSVTNKNMVVNYGLIGIAGVIAGTPFPSTGGFTHIALGDSNTAPTLSDTNLVNVLRMDAAVVTQLPAPNNNKVFFQVEHAQGAAIGTFREAGLFDADSSGNMFNRLVFEDFVVGASDTLTVTWTIEVRNV